jgi:hypothetical protein
VLDIGYSAPPNIRNFHAMEKPNPGIQTGCTGFAGCTGFNPTAIYESPESDPNPANNAFRLPGMDGTPLPSALLHPQSTDADGAASLPPSLAH